MGLIKITADMTESERTAVLNANMQYLQLSNRLRKYPIGMIVAFDTDIDPNELYGGTWERIKGKFIWGIEDGETAGATGGSKAHTHTLRNAFAKLYAHFSGGGGFSYAEMSKVEKWNTTHNVAGNNASENVANATYGTAIGGTTDTANNMPPYYGAYIWRKTGHGIGEDPTLTEYEAFVQQMNTAISEALSKERLITNAACANALRSSASGAAVSLTDVSPNEHTLGVKVRGKNLFDINTTPTFTRTGATYSISGTTITFKSNNTTNNSFYYSIPVEIGKTYTVSVSSIDWDSTSQGIFLSSINASDRNNYGIINKTTLSKTFTANANTLWIHGYLSYPAGDFTFSFDKLQVEEGITATAYTPYVSDFSTVTVTRYGKNLFDKSIPISSYIRLDNSYKYLKYYVGIGTNVAVSISEKPAVPNDNGFMYVYPGAIPKADVNAKWLAHQTVINLCSQQQTVVSTDGYICLVVSVSKALDYYGNSIQIELGTTATEYEPYKMPTEYTPAADGTVSGVKSLYPTTTLMTDTNGAIIEAEYNRDINKAFAELQQAILSMGGNT